MSDVAVPRRLLELVSQSEFWVTALRNEAERLERLGRLLGVPVIAVTTVTGAAIFTQLNSNPASWAKVLFGLVNLLAAVLAAAVVLGVDREHARGADHHVVDVGLGPGHAQVMADPPSRLAPGAPTGGRRGVRLRRRAAMPGSRGWAGTAAATKHPPPLPGLKRKLRSGAESSQLSACPMVAAGGRTPGLARPHSRKPTARSEAGSCGCQILGRRS